MCLLEGGETVACGSSSMDSSNHNILMSLLCCCLCSFVYTGGEKQVSVNIGVILQLDWFGRVAKPAFELAAEQVNKNGQWLNSTGRLILHFRDSKGDPIEAASAAVELLESGAVAIIGPQTSQEAGFVAKLCDVAQVPMLSFSATDPLLSSRRFPYFIRLPRSDAFQTKAIAAVVKHYGWRQVVAVFADNEYGTGMVSPLSQALLEAGSQIVYRCPILTSATTDFIRAELYKLMTMQSRVFVVHMTLELGQVLFSLAHDIGMMGREYVWIITEGFSSVLDVLDSSTLDSMKGVLGIRTYIPKSADFSTSWKDKFRADNPEENKPAKINTYAYYAHDAVSIIAGAVHKLNTTVFNFSPSPLSRRTNIKIFEEGARLLDLLSQTDDVGLTGRLRAKRKGELELANSAYEILNVFGGAAGYRTVGYWRNRKHGLTQRIGNPSVGVAASGLQKVMWPGGSETTPRGWATPVNRHTELKIGVPINRGFEQFVATTHDEVPTVSGGFVIDVFQEVVKGLPYALPYRFIPHGDGNVSPPFEEMVKKLHTKEYDAIVGDFTILADRSDYVDFTQPYFESGLVMVVPIQKTNSSNAWAFMRPFTPGMWIATGGFLLLTGCVVWVLEHKTNKTFRGKPGRQIVTLLWFSFSTLFFAQRERIISSLARLVVIIWLFVVLILTSSYTASLTSMLTVQQMEPSSTNVRVLIASRAPVGYQRGSFVGHYLREMLGFHENQLRAYSSTEEYATALSKGPQNGGVAAVFDELPYIQVFLSNQCGFTMVGPTYRTGGLGFVFAKGSPLVSDVSKSVLKLSESVEMQRIQNKWFNMTTCTKAVAQIDSNRLSLESFWGLYLVTGITSIVTLLLFFLRLLYRYARHSPVPHNMASILSKAKRFVNFMDNNNSIANIYNTNTNITPSILPVEESPNTLSREEGIGSSRISSDSWFSIDLESEIEEEVSDGSHS